MELKDIVIYTVCCFIGLLVTCAIVGTMWMAFLENTDFGEKTALARRDLRALEKIARRYRWRGRQESSLNFFRGRRINCQAAEIVERAKRELEELKNNNL